MTLVLVASRRDEAARLLAARWNEHGAAVLTCADLARPGWRLTPGGAADDAAIVDGRRVGSREVTGVLVRLPHVDAAELPHVAEADRSYVAAELEATLYAWLADLRCAVVDRPSTAATRWSREAWLWRAAALGIPVAPSTRRTAHRSPVEPVADLPVATVTVVGGRAVDRSGRQEAARARSLAAATGMQALVAQFDERRRLLDVTPWPDVREDPVADALLEVLAAA